jgi:murein DD-endopeptidase MepM/ murein hydrolase activator NlpD
MGLSPRGGKRVNRAYFAVLPLIAPLIFATIKPVRTVDTATLELGPEIRYEAQPTPAGASIPRWAVYLPVDRGDTLDSLLMTAGLDRGEAAGLASLLATDVDPRKLRQGQLIRFEFSDEGRVESVELKLTGWGVVRGWRDGSGFATEAKAAPASESEVVVSATVESSLYGAIRSSGEDAQLVQKLVDVFQWDIDFFRLQRGDEFSLVVSRKYVGDDFVGYGPILAARMVHAGRTHEAFHYESADMKGYYNRDGAPLRKQFLKAPLKYSRITSGFTNKRFHPILQTFRAHAAIDYGAPVGTPVMSTADGVVTVAGHGRAEGNFVRIRHNRNVETLYLHLSRFAKGIAKGSKIEQGQVIGYVGMTGLATGPHLHYEVRENGKGINPLNLKSVTADPLIGASLREFKGSVQLLLPKLETESRLAEK